MAELITVLQNLVAIAFAALGIATAIQWLRHRDPSLGWLALAIIALSIVSSIGRIQPWLGFVAPVIPYLSLAAFMGSGYALLRYRDSIIPIDPRWIRVATAAVLIALALGVLIATPGVARALPSGARLALGLPLLVVWAAFVGETAVRFWLVSRSLTVVTRWRLRSLSLGFAGLVLIIVFAIGASAILKTPAAQIIVELAVLAIIPLLYVSFSPPGWLRRQWRSSEEEDLKRFMEDLLLLGEEPASLQEQVLDWALRLVGGQSALVVRADGTVDARGIDPAEVDRLVSTLEQMADGLRSIVVGGITKPALLLSTPAIDGASRVLLIAGPFTPALGSDEMRRAQQFVSATTAALDRARLVERLQVANTQLQEANEHKSVFLANMSHELRTPLNAILGFSELLIDDVGQQRLDSATGLSFLEQIHTSGQHLLGLINDILDLSKIEAGQMELRLEVVDVDQIINEAVTMVEPLADKKQIRLEAARGGGRLLADSAKLHQMLLNLLSNAIKFTPQGGSVEIAVANFADSLQIDVRDSGIGIAPADQERIFGEFQQVDSSVARQQTGTGLGLTLTRRFALLHNGSLTVRSEVGMGSTFRLTLPRTIGAAGTREVAAKDTPAPELGEDRPLVLVVEDHPPAAELVVRHLARGGFRAEVARTGTEAVALARELRPVAITLDILLPELDGWGVLNQLKQEESTSDIPVVVVSVVDNPDLGRALGAIDYFVKPVSAKELLNRLNRYRFGRRFGREEVRVLVVDDEEANRRWLTEILEPAGFTVIAAKGGRDAIEFAQSGRPDLVLLDLLMPEVNGFDVVSALRATEATAAIPIMILTGKNLSKSDKRQLNGHVAAILSRGSTGSAELLEWLNQVVTESTIS